MAGEPTFNSAIDRPSLDVQLRRYDRGFRRRLRKFAGTSRTCADLVYTFPALAIVFAIGQGGGEARRRAIVLAGAGAPLRDVAAAVALPMWMRRLPPEAFVEFVPPLPASEDFAVRIVNLVPAEPAHAAMWLRWVYVAYRFNGERFAIWLAKRGRFDAADPGAACLWPLAAYAWFSGVEGHEACGLIRRPWKSGMGFAAAVEETRSFMLRIMLDHCREQHGRQGRWYVEQRASGYRIVPLRTTAELLAEGDGMNNCVASYAEAVARGDCLIYGIRRGNRHVATLEVRPHWGRQGAPVIAQLEGPSNGPASDDIRRAVDKWVSRQGRFPVTAPEQLATVQVDAARWISLWEPFWDHVGQSRMRRDGSVVGQLAHVSASLRGLRGLAKF